MWPDIYATKLEFNVTNYREIAKFSRHLGIELIPEVNIPSRASTWSTVADDIVTKCKHHACKYGEAIALDPSRQYLTYNRYIHLFYDSPNVMNAVEKILGEFSVGNFYHLGKVDALTFNCWNESDHIKEWMHRNNIKEFGGIK
jgi:N-acetyl-beta-hexosaminidase